MGRRIGKTYEAREHSIARLDADLSAAVVDGIVDLGFAVGAGGAVEADAFHGVVEDLVVGFGGVEFGVLVDGGEVLLAGGGEVVVEELGKLIMP